MSDEKDKEETKEEVKEETKEAPSFGDQTIDELMITNVETFSPNMTVKKCIELMLAKKISGAPIVKENTRKVVSSIGQKELIQFAAVGGLDKPLLGFLGQLKKADELIFAAKTDTLRQVIIKFLRNPVRRLMVLDDEGNLEGILTRSQLLKAFMDSN